MGTTDPEIIQVSRGVCELCVTRVPAPNPKLPNPVAASIICVAGERVVERGGIEGCDEKKARTLIHWAAQHLDLAGSKSDLRAARHGRRDPCIYLGEQTGEKACGTCRGSVRQKVFQCRHEGHHEDTTILDCAACPDHEAQLVGESVKTWVTGVTTAPRPEPTLDRSLRSLADAGWPDALVFAEPDSYVPDWLEPHRLVQRPTTLGAWPNWLMSLQELTLRYPWADAYLLCQDDVVYTRDLRAYLETTLWPSERVGVASLHTALHQDSGKRGWSMLGEGEVMAWGAQAYAIPNPAARALLRSPLVVNHRHRGPRHGLCNIDTVIGQWCETSGFPYFVHSPSLTEHVGDTSAIWTHGDTTGRRHAGTFPGEDSSICEEMGMPTPRAVPVPKPTTGDSWTGKLSVCSAVIGRRGAFDPWRRWLQEAEIPSRTSLHLLDNSGDPEFSDLVRDTAIEIGDSDRFGDVHLHIRRHPPKVPGRNSPQRHWNVADAYNAALGNSKHDEDFVFLLDDDTIPPVDCLPRLYAALSKLAADGKNPGAISGCYESAGNRGHYVATRSMIGWSRQVAVDSLAADEIVEVGTVGSGCLLLNASLFWACFPVRGESLTGVMGPDSYLCTETRRRGFSVWLHGGVVCDHLYDQ